MFRHSLYPYSLIIHQLFNEVSELLLFHQKLKTEQKYTNDSYFDLRPSQTSFSSHRPTASRVPLQVFESRRSSMENNLESQAHSNRFVGTAKFLKNIIMPKTFSKVTPYPQALVIFDSKSKASSILPGDKWGVADSFRDVLVALGETPDEIMPLLNPLIIPEIPETEFTRMLDTGDRTRLLAAFISRTFDRLSETKDVAVVLDNVHFMDSASWMLTKQIINRCKNAKVLTTNGSSLCRHLRL